MLIDAINEINSKFKMRFYRGIFERLRERESSLSASEAIAVDVIHALDAPTISKFADFLHISLPNATYKINTLVRKGYIEKVQSSTDKREFHLHTTSRFSTYNSINQDYIDKVVDRAMTRFSPDEIEQLERMLRIVSEELMPEDDS